ncbi:MAG: hypothetical protein KGZ39_00770 [Simkania sp.]|nr:hypothetical protein [Simkania sp.]
MSIENSLNEFVDQSASSIALPSFRFQTETRTVDRLVQIFQKIRDGVVLSIGDRDFLIEASKFRPSIRERLSSWISTPTDEGSVREINALALQILQKELPSAPLVTRVEEKLVSNRNPSARETAYLARLVSSCLTRDSSFPEVLERFKEQGGKDTPTRGELIDLVMQFNREALPKISLAGSSICRVSIIQEGKGIRDVEIRYNQEGYLEIIDGPVSPLDISYRQTLTASQQEEICALYHTLADGAYYNNLGELLEFIGYFRQAREGHPGLTLQAAYASYHPNLEGIFDKYQSGTCILLATKFSQSLERQGIQVQCVARLTSNSWSKLPIPEVEESPKWSFFSEEIKGFEHTDVICCFTDENGDKGIFKFQCSFEKNNPKEIQKFLRGRIRSGPETFFLEEQIHGGEDYPNRLVDHGEIAKARLKGRFKAVMMKDKMIFGIDFLKGNIYINSSWAATMEGLPLRLGKVSIDFEDLANPDAIGTYQVDGVERELSHREALRIVLDKVRSHMIIPENMEEDLIAVAQNSAALFEEIFIQPLPMIKAHYDDLVVIGQKMKTLKTMAEDKTIPITRYKELDGRYCDIINLFSKPSSYQEIGAAILALQGQLVDL